LRIFVFLPAIKDEMPEIMIIAQEIFSIKMTKFESCHETDK